MTLILGIRCSDTVDPAALKPDPPALIIIGVDNSITFKRHDKFDIASIEALSDVLINSGRGGTIVFKLIGNPSVKSEFTCDIDPYDVDCNKLSATAKIQCKKKKQIYDEQKKQEISTFIQKCTAELKRPLEKETDLNGFFRLAQRFADQPHRQEYKKYLFVYSDGFHDVQLKNGKFDKEVDCSLLPGAVITCVSGWQNPVNCNFKYDFTSTQEFFSFLKKDLAQKSTATSKK